jgi:hypothetical protein
LANEKLYEQMKKWTLILAMVTCSLMAFSQEEKEEEKEGGFKKQNIFTGGSISLSFGNRSFLVGGNPMLGYKIAEWIDAGIVLNYQYTSFRDYDVIGDKLRQNIYGGGVFTRIYPVNFLFGQAQFEHNFITLKYLPPDGSSPSKAKTSGNSFLVGAGYTQGRIRGLNDAFFYLSVLWDISNNEASPYTDVYGRATPIFRAGVNVYLFRSR